MHPPRWAARATLIAASLCAGLISGAAFAQSKEIKIAHIYSKTGPLEAYGKQTQTGFMMGLDYATGGTMTVAGKKIVVIEKDQRLAEKLAQKFHEQKGFEILTGDALKLLPEILSTSKLKATSYN